jgi:8-oxo-dGTP pyrophosphatase MutT (NUDIX family)
VIVSGGRVLLVNAYPGDASDLWCTPGGGAERGTSLEANLRREVEEETGLDIRIGRLLALTEFHNSETGFHQVELYFRAGLADPSAAAALRDPEGVVNRLRWVRPCDLESLRFKPDTLPVLAFGPEGEVVYNPLEIMAI